MDWSHCSELELQSYNFVKVYIYRTPLLQAGGDKVNF